MARLPVGGWPSPPERLRFYQGLRGSALPQASPALSVVLLAEPAIMLCVLRREFVAMSAMCLAAIPMPLKNMNRSSYILGVRNGPHMGWVDAAAHSA